MDTMWRWVAAGIGMTSALAACAQGSPGTGVAVGGSGGATTTTTATGGAASSSSSSTSSTSSSSSSSSSGTTSLCGNGTVDPGEQCDSFMFNGATCQSMGYEMGTLQCDFLCEIDTSACVPFPDCTQPTSGCTDPFCATQPVCVDSCGAPFPSGSLPTFIDGDNTSYPHTQNASCSSATPGPEQIFAVTPTTTGRMLVDLEPESSAAFSVSVRTDCPVTVALDAGPGPGDAGAGTELACSNKPNPSFFGDVVVAVPVTAGVTYYVIVQGMTTTDVGPYFLSLDYVTDETSCDDFQDNDFNGFTDCDDPNCQTMSTSCVPGIVATGALCSTNADCTANKHDPICFDFNLPQFPNGYCSEFCDLANDDCSPGNVCYGGLGISQDGVCLHSCTSDADCRASEGYACVSRGLSTKVCMHAPETLCNDYSDNDYNGVMDCADANCQPLPACVPGTTAIGQPCSLHGNCTASTGLNNPFCIDDAHEFYNKGYCSHFCDPAKANDCGAGATCVNNQNIYVNQPNGNETFGAYVCMVTCTMSSQCRTADGYSCIAGVCDY